MREESPRPSQHLRSAGEFAMKSLDSSVRRNRPPSAANRQFYSANSTNFNIGSYNSVPRIQKFFIRSLAFHISHFNNNLRIPKNRPVYTYSHSASPSQNLIQELQQAPFPTTILSGSKQATYNSVPRIRKFFIRAFHFHKSRFNNHLQMPKIRL